MTTLRQKMLYQKFVEQIKEQGERFNKKHGEWYRVKSPLGYFVLDTWSKSIRLYKDKCEPVGEHIIWGFEGNYKSLGIDFGGFKCVPNINYYRLHMVTP